MKRKILKFAAIVMLLAGTAIACESKIDDQESSIIEKEIDGIAFKFCLLNEQGEPATVFNEGENIIFSLSFKNNLEKNVFLSTEFINTDFYRVYGDKNTDMAKAWTGVWCNYNYEDMLIELSPHKHKQFNCPWLLLDIFQPDYPLCKGDNMNPLSVGKYSTTLHFDLSYIMGEQRKSIKNINFKINFYINK
jgi:hypothetical protein